MRSTAEQPIIAAVAPGKPKADEQREAERTRLLRALPSIDVCLKAALSDDRLRDLGRSYLRNLARDAQHEFRASVASGAIEVEETREQLLGQMVGRMLILAQADEPRLRKVVNATGVVLHTNLGRALLAETAIEAAAMAARSAINLEYDLACGARGERDTVVENELRELTGAEAATVVNNNAAAVLLTLNTLAAGREVVVSRGELVEIGGAFRIPDIMARSGATLIEVGTTNRTHPKDYQNALTDATRLLLKVHQSNFRVTGFTAEVPASEIAALARAHGSASLYDLGSGLLLDLAPWGLTSEPTVHEARASGVDAVVFSGDKLLGGPQAGIILGTRAAIEACRQDPLARAVRSDKLTLAALEATLALYRDPDTARREIPVLRMLTEDGAETRRRAEALCQRVGAEAELVAGESEVGGGSFPGARLPTWLVALRPAPPAPDVVAARLRAAQPPLIARIAEDRVVLDARTIFPDQLETVARVVRAALDG
jgi:L-seryl-tRNA(Ser) seleniumtransferase